MIKTKLTKMFGIDYPIVQSGMQWLAVPQLASAVCNAGGIGTINVTCWLLSTSLQTRSTR